MLTLDKILENGRIDAKKSMSNEHVLPRIVAMNKQDNDKLEHLANANLSTDIFDDILDYYKKPKYRTDNNISENIKFLLQIQKVAKKYDIRYGSDTKSMDSLVVEYKELVKVLEEEKRIDLIEIRLARMKEKHATRHNMQMLYDCVKNRAVSEDMLKYFAFVTELPIVNEIREEHEMIQRIRQCSDSTEKRVFLYLYDNKSEHIGMLADKLGVERLELLQVITKMETETDAIMFDRSTDIVHIKYYE